MGHPGIFARPNKRGLHLPILLLLLLANATITASAPVSEASTHVAKSIVEAAPAFKGLGRTGDGFIIMAELKKALTSTAKGGGEAGDSAGNASNSSAGASNGSAGAVSEAEDSEGTELFAAEHEQGRWETIRLPGRSVTFFLPARPAVALVPSWTLWVVFIMSVPVAGLICFLSCLGISW